MKPTRAVVVALLFAAPVACQTANDPFSQPIAGGGPIVVGVTEFATIPGPEDSAPRIMNLIDEVGTDRLFVNAQQGPLFSVSYDGRSVTLYLDTNDSRWGYEVQSQGRERGFQSFAFHPRFAQSGQRGFGKFYTWTDILDTVPEADFLPPPGGRNSHDTVLLEWTALDPTAPTYDGGPPRELMRFEQPFPNHNAGQLAFNPTVEPDDPDFAMLYIGSADGGSGGDPLGVGQDMMNGLGKILRINPLGTNSQNGEYGIPSDNPFVGDASALDEIYAYGVRNPQRFGWDSENGNLFLADIGQNIIEELSQVTAGANLGWNTWEGSYRFISRQAVDLENPRSDASVTYPVAEYGQPDRLLQGQSAATGVHVYRANRIPQIADMILWADLPSGEVWAIPADDVSYGGQEVIERILFEDGGQQKTLLQLIQEKNQEQGRNPASRADVHIASGPNGEPLLTNKADGVIRMLTPNQ